MQIAKLSLKILLFIILLLSIFTMITSRSSILAGIRSFVVLSGSMESALPVGSMIFVSPSWPYQKGDIVAFENTESQTVTHRIAAKTIDSGSSIFLMRGDANQNPDSELISEGQVLGKQLLMIPYIGYFISYLRTIQGFALFILLPTLVYIGLELWNIKKEIVAQTEKRIMEKLSQSTIA